jgi:hypothetical protein
MDEATAATGQAIPGELTINRVGLTMDELGSGIGGMLSSVTRA